MPQGLGLEWADETYNIVTYFGTKNSTCVFKTRTFYFFTFRRIIISGCFRNTYMKIRIAETQC